MSFAERVPYETICLTTFNYWEPSLGIEKNGRTYTVYHAKNQGDINVVVIEGFRMRKGENTQYDYFFRTFAGKHSGECDTNKEEEQFFDRLRETVSSKYRVRGRDLENRVRDALGLERIVKS